MAKSFKFEDNTNVVVLDRNNGEFQTEYGADVEYVLDRSDKAVLLVINDWFDLNSIDDMIAFLQAAKQELTK